MSKCWHLIELGLKSVYDNSTLTVLATYTVLLPSQNAFSALSFR